MVRRILKWIGFALGGLAALLVLAAIVIFVASEVIWTQNYQNLSVPVEKVPIPSDEASIARGNRLASIRLCRGCHGDDLGGAAFGVPPVLLTLDFPNLTPGRGGVGASYSDEDWVRAIRHGVGHDRQGLMIMPAPYFYYMSDEELGALIAYLKTLPPVDHELPKRGIGPVGRLMLVLGQLPKPVSTKIDHNGPRPAAPKPGITVEYGQYLARPCAACHGPDYAGSAVGDGGGQLVIPNLTPGGELRAWSEGDFINTLRTGITPSMHQLKDPMPWKYAGQMSDDELRALWMFLRSLPALEQSYKEP